MALGLVAGSNIVAPAGLQWPQGSYPVSARWNGSKYVTNFNPASYAQPALSGPVYKADLDAGNDTTGNGLSTPVKSVWKAQQLLNATGQPGLITVKKPAGIYCPREYGVSNSSTAVPNTVPTAIICDPGTRFFAGSFLSWPGSKDATYTNSYRVARSNVSRVLDIVNVDSSGNPTDLIKRTSGTLVNSTAGWAQESTDLIVQRLDGLAPTNSNTIVLLKATPQLVTDATSKDLYVKNAAFHGGTSGAVACTAQATLNLMLEDVFAGYAGDDLVNVNAYKFDYTSGLIAAVRCSGAYAEADIFNDHWTPGGQCLHSLLTIDCIGYEAGRDTTLSCNLWTIHDTCRGWDIGGDYSRGYGANVIPIGSSVAFGLGTYAHDSYGDVSHGGVTTPTDFQTQNSAQLWLQGTRSSGSATSLLASNASTIYKHNHTSGPGQTEGAGGGTITAA